MFKIGDFSKVCRVPVSALRYYADIGLLDPAHIDTFTGYRYYSLSQLPRLNRILALKDLGLSLTEIKHLLDTDKDLNVDELRGMLKLKQAELEKELSERQAQLNRVEARLNQIQQEGKMPEKEVVLKQIDAQTVLAYRFTASEPTAIAEVMGQVYPGIYSQGIMAVGALGILYHSPDFNPEAIDAELIYPVPDSFEDDVKVGDSYTLKPRQLAAVEVASLTHHGSYDELQSCYIAIGKWVEANKYEIVDAVRELYLTAPDDPEGPITEIQFPVVKAS